MNQASRYKTLCFFIVIVVSSYSAEAAEVRVMPQCQCNDAFVMLGHIADVRDDNFEQSTSLSSIRLFPTPSAVRVVRREEIQQLLALNSVDISECRFSGSRIVRIVGPTIALPTANAPLPLSPETVQRAKQRIRTMILDQMKQYHSAQQAWHVDVELDEKHVRPVAAFNNQLLIEEGQHLMVGRQTMQLAIRSPQGSQRIGVTATISETDLIVSTKQAIRAGETIRAEYLELRPEPSAAGIRDLVHRIDDVVGHEAIRPIGEGQPVLRSSVRSPILVRRGELVTVFAVASGVRVRTNGTVQEDGSQGDLVTVQSLDEKRQRYTARVTDFQTVEVYAGGARVDGLR